MDKEQGVSKSRGSEKHLKGTSSKDRNLKEKQSSKNKDLDDKSSKSDVKRELNPSPSSTQKFKKSKGNNLGNKIKVVERKVVPQGSPEFGLKDGNSPSESLPTSITSSPLDPSKSTEQNYWKEFPIPKFYKELKKFYDPIPKTGELPPSLYFPYDGSKLRRYKNYRPYKDPLSKYNDEEYYKKDLKELIMGDLQNFNRKLDLIQLDVEMSSLGVPGT